MKKLYRKGAVHPSPPTKPCHLSLLPANLLLLTAALCPEDKEVLSYLISSSNTTGFEYFAWDKSKKHKRVLGNNRNSNSNNKNEDHPPMFNCDCFRCYMSYWIRWDSSPNRELIHEIIEALEDELEEKKKKKKKNNKAKGNYGNKEGKKRGSNNGVGDPGEVTRVESTHKLGDGSDSAAELSGGGGEAVEEEIVEKGSMRKFVSFIGEKISGVWG